MAETFSFTDDEIQLLLKIYIEYKAEREYCGVDWKSVRNKYEQIQETMAFQTVKTRSKLWQ